LLLAVSAGATFVGRGFSAEPQKLADLIVAGIEHKGFSFIDVYSPCPTFNKVNTFKSYREEVAPLPAGHDASSFDMALKAASSQDPRYMGVIYQREGESFEQHLEDRKSGTEQDLPKLLDSLFARYG